MNKVLVTGSAGFIGSHLVEKLLLLGCEVNAFVHYNSLGSYGWLSGINKHNLKIISGDIRDYDSVYNAMIGCDTIFHLAALIGIPYSYISPMAYIKTNIEGTYNILEAAKKIGVENVNVTSTSETYGSAQYVPIDELHPLVGQSPYAATKIAADQLSLSYYKSFNLPVNIVRPFNTYGPRQSARAIIPTVITQILSGKNEIKLGSIEPTRDLNYVFDTVNGFIEIAKNKKFFGDYINICTGKEISIGNLVYLIAELMGSEVIITKDNERVRPVGSEVERLLGDNNKICGSTAWSPSYSLREGLLETIKWFKNNTNLYKADIYNV